MRKAIGVMDSGLGGLAVVKCLNKLLPNEDIIFLADNKRMPYGNKAENTIKRYAKENTLFLADKNIKALAIACNTLDSTSHNIIQKHANNKAYGLILESSKKAIKLSNNKHIGIFATKATINTHIYKKTIKELDKNSKVYEIACPNLASLIELNASKEIIKKELIKYLKKLNGKDVDTLILGCTHYHFLKDILKQLNPKLNIISSAYELAYAIKKDLNNKNNHKGKNTFLVTKYYDEYQELYRSLLNDKKIILKEISI